MASKAFEFELVSPEGIVLQEEVTDLVAVTGLGEIGILNNHANLKSNLDSAPVRYTKADGSQDVVAVIGGIIEVQDNKTVILTDFAEKAMDIDEAEAKAEAEKAEAEVQLLSPKAPKTDRDLILAEARLQKELLRLKTAKLRKGL